MSTFRALAGSSAAVVAAAASIALSSPALATSTISDTAGPVSFAAAPVAVCLQSDTAQDCVETQPGTTAEIMVSVTARKDVGPGDVAPSISAGTCSGDGVALMVDTGSTGAVITGLAAVMVDGGTEIFSMGPMLAPASQQVHAGACAVPDPLGLSTLLTGLVDLVGTLLA